MAEELVDIDELPVIEVAVAEVVVVEELRSIIVSQGEDMDYWATKLMCHWDGFLVLSVLR